MIPLVIVIAFAAIGAQIYSGGGWVALALYVIGAVVGGVAMTGMQVLAYTGLDWQDSRQLDKSFDNGTRLASVRQAISIVRTLRGHPRGRALVECPRPL